MCNWPERSVIHRPQAHFFRHLAVSGGAIGYFFRCYPSHSKVDTPDGPRRCRFGDAVHEVAHFSLKCLKNRGILENVRLDISEPLPRLAGPGNKTETAP